MSSLSVTQLYANTDFSISAPGAWEISVPDSGRENDINIILRGSGDTRTTTGLFGTGMHIAYLREGGRTTAQETWEERELVRVPMPLPVPPAPLPGVGPMPPLYVPPGSGPYGNSYTVGGPGQCTPGYSEGKDIMSGAWTGKYRCTWAPQPDIRPLVDAQTKELAVQRTGLQKVSEYLDGLRKSLDGTISGISARIDELQKGIDGIWDRLEGWLVLRLVGLMLRALDREVAEAKK